MRSVLNCPAFDAKGGSTRTRRAVPGRDKTTPHRKESFMAWVYLLFAGLLEICWAIGLKYTDGFTRLGPSVFVGVTLAASMFLLALAARTLPIGTAYAVWVGIGALGAAILGVILFQESLTPPRIVFLSLLLISIVGLKLSVPSDPSITAGDSPAANEEQSKN